MAVRKECYCSPMGRREFFRIAAGISAGGGLLPNLLHGPASEPGPIPTLRKRRLGRTEHYSSIIAFGGIALAPLTVEESRREVLTAFEQGVNHFDVAPSYADAESKLGPALEGIRDRVFLACKTLERGRSGAEKELDNSLRLLRTDHFDLYQFHAVDAIEDLEAILAPGGAAEAVLQARDAGKVRFIGITGHFAPTQTVALKHFPFDTLMVPVDFVDCFYFGAQTGLLALAHEKDVGVIAIKSTYRGAVQDKVSAYRYTLSLPVSTTIPAGKIEEIKLAIEVAKQFQPMTTEEIVALLRDSPELGNKVCRQCQHCMPCPQGVDIPLVFALEGFGARYRRTQAASMYASLLVKVTACNDCGQCRERCPYGLAVVDDLRRAHGLLAGPG